MVYSEERLIEGEQWHGRARSRIPDAPYDSQAAIVIEIQAQVREEPVGLGLLAILLLSPLPA
jgi:hypothetical protein